VRSNSSKSVLTAAREHRRQLGPIGPTPAVKAWLDTVIVPALVREFLANGKTTSPVLSDKSSDEVAYSTAEKDLEDKQ
jgi:hypothetical protein